MKKLLPVLLLFVPLTVCGQYIGHPAGKNEPRGVTKPDVLYVRGMGGVEAGYNEVKTKTRYDTGAGVEESSSTLRDLYFALYGGGHALGAELEAKIGATFQDVRDTSLAEDPFENGVGVIVGGSARWGFQLFDRARLGLGGQLLYSQSDGESIVTLEGTRSLERVTSKLWRGEIFVGGGLDFPLGSTGTLSPYLGAGINLMDGKLTYRDHEPTYPGPERFGTIKQDHLEFFFGGVDFFVMDQVRLSFEGRGNASGFGAFCNLGWSF